MTTANPTNSTGFAAHRISDGAFLYDFSKLSSEEGLSPVVVSDGTLVGVSGKYNVYLLDYSSGALVHTIALENTSQYHPATVYLDGEYMLVCRAAINEYPILTWYRRSDYSIVGELKNPFDREYFYSFKGMYRYEDRFLLGDEGGNGKVFDYKLQTVHEVLEEIIESLKS